jgi:hypothetical protein
MGVDRVELRVERNRDGGSDPWAATAAMQPEGRTARPAATAQLQPPSGRRFDVEASGVAEPQHHAYRNRCGLHDEELCRATEGGSETLLEILIPGDDMTVVDAAKDLISATSLDGMRS